MYRTYENPFTIEDRLQTAKAERAEIEKQLDKNESDRLYLEDELMEKEIEIAELEDASKAAWDDDEFYCDDCE